MNRIPIRWSPERLAELDRLSRVTPSRVHPIESVLATAYLKLASEDFDGAEMIVLDALKEHTQPGRLGEATLIPLLAALLTVDRLDVASQLICERYSPGCQIDLVVATESGPGRSLIVWETLLPERMKFTFDSWFVSDGGARGRIIAFTRTFPLFAAYARNWPGDNGRVVYNGGDRGIAPGLANCDHRVGYFLVPDTMFIASQGYARTRQHYAEHDVPWDQRIPLAFWRGSTTGFPTDPAIGWPSLPRVRLCEIGRDRRVLFDCAITQIVRISDPLAQEKIRSAGLMGDYVPSIEFNRYKYQIDIDGNTSSWPGLFQKLLTGSTVLKVASSKGFRQWYYDRLRPWINYVPVAADMSDLVELVEWLQANDETAREIGEKGRELALSLDCEGELRRSARTISAAMRYFSGRPELELHFNVEATAYTPCLREGWDEPSSEGVLASGLESRICLPRPVAGGDYVLELDISPYVLPSTSLTQRLNVVVNGQVVSHTKLVERQLVRCILPRRLLQCSNELTISLLHPDGQSLASFTRPLDGRVASVTLHALILTAADAARP